VADEQTDRGDHDPARGKQAPQGRADHGPWLFCFPPEVVRSIAGLNDNVQPNVGVVANIFAAGCGTTLHSFLAEQPSSRAGP
jgi:hypothetical protein